MSKGLQALEEIKTCRLIKRMKYKEGLFSNKLIDYEMTYGKDAFYRQIPIIEKELKEYEKLKDNYKQLGKSYDLTCEELTKTIDTITCLRKRELKALEIIRNKNVDTRDLFVVFDWFGRGEEELALNDYNSRHKTDEEYNNITLTLEEFNLLKEVLL